MPGPARPRVEAEHNTRIGVWEEEFNRYRAINCNEKGEPKTTNLTKRQQMALKALGKKVAKNEVIILQADKGKKFVVVDENTHKIMADHIKGDKEIAPEEVRKCQTILTTTAKALANIIGLVKDQSQKNYSRCMDNVGSEAEDAPTLKIMPKVHKPLNQEGIPQSRPVVAAASGLSSRAGDILADFLAPIVCLYTPRMEDKSTEEVLAQLEETQKMLVETGTSNNGRKSGCKGIIP